MIENNINKQTENWKKVLSEYLKKLKLIHNEFTGDIKIDLFNGGVGDVKKTETLK